MPSRIRDAERHLLDAGERALRIIAEDLLSRSQKRVPLDEGTLARSGHVEPVIVGADGRRTIRVAYGTPYAARRHEETHAPSGVPIQFSVPGRGAKYLEGPLKEMGPRYRAALERAIAQAS